MPETAYYELVSNSLICSGEYSVSSWFERATIVVHPSMIRIKDGRSYLQMNFSCRYLIASSVLIMIPTAVSVEIRTRSTNGSVAAWISAETIRRIKPIM